MKTTKFHVRRIAALAFVLCLGLVGSSSFAQGTLGIGDGTLPFKLRGTVMEPGPGGVRNLPADVVINQLRPIAPGQRPSFLCQNQSPTTTLQTASGLLTIEGVRYTVKGACHDETNNRLEIVAVREVQAGRFVEARLAGVVDNNIVPNSYNGDVATSPPGTNVRRFVMQQTEP
jgi:hypothetical protein